ncbi:MAG TPA: D-inositol-3-phosphate glycosyltransferase, partial [Pseudonocardiaceae bacterium]
MIRRVAGPQRVAVLSVHTSPLEQPGTGDAGGMNVYIEQTAARMAARGVAVEVFTRATSSELPPVVELAPGVTVRHIAAGPFEGLAKNDLPGQLCAFTAGVLRAEARHEPGHYSVVHSHYWLSGQVGWLARDRWGVPLVHSAHTLAKVKNAALADGDTPEPAIRVIGEQQVVAEADRLVANTDVEARQLVHFYDADPDTIVTVPPGVDLARFAPGPRRAARRQLGLRDGDTVLVFAGRIQPLKAPDVVLRAAAELVRRDPELRQRLAVLVVGGPSGTGLERPHELAELAAALGIADVVRFLPPQPRERLATVFRAADLVAVPSHNESFGLVALEAQACG